MSCDPLSNRFPWMSPFCAFDNTPILKIDPTGKSGIVTIDKENKTITVTSHYVFYGEGSSPELATQTAQDIQNKWNAANGKVTIDNVEYSVQFDITAEHRDYTLGRIDPNTGAIVQNSLENEIANNTDYKNNYIKVEGRPTPQSISYMDSWGAGDGANTGVWYNENINGEGTTTEGHESAHGWGAVKGTRDHHPVSKNLIGSCLPPGILYPRGVLVDEDYRYSNWKETGYYGLDANKREVNQEDIDYLNLDKLEFDDKGSAKIGGLTKKKH